MTQKEDYRTHIYIVYRMIPTYLFLLMLLMLWISTATDTNITRSCCCWCCCCTAATTTNGNTWLRSDHDGNTWQFIYCTINEEKSIMNTIGCSLPLYLLLMLLNFVVTKTAENTRWLRSDHDKRPPTVHTEMPKIRFCCCCCCCCCVIYMNDNYKRHL